MTPVLNLHDTRTRRWTLVVSVVGTCRTPGSSRTTTQSDSGPVETGTGLSGKPEVCLPSPTSRGVQTGSGPIIFHPSEKLSVSGNESDQKESGGTVKPGPFRLRTDGSGAGTYKVGGPVVTSVPFPRSLTT